MYPQRVDTANARPAGGPLNRLQIRQIGRALRWMREHRNLKQYQVARSAGVTRPMLSAYETGKQLPSLITLANILDALDAGLEELARALDMVSPVPHRKGQWLPHPGSLPPTLQEEGAFEAVEAALHRWLQLIRDRLTQPP